MICDGFLYAGNSAGSEKPLLLIGCRSRARATATQQSTPPRFSQFFSLSFVPQALKQTAAAVCIPPVPFSTDSKSSSSIPEMLNVDPSLSQTLPYLTTMDSLTPISIFCLYRNRLVCVCRRPLHQKCLHVLNFEVIVFYLTIPSTICSFTYTVENGLRDHILMAGTKGQSNQSQG